MIYIYIYVAAHKASGKDNINTYDTHENATS